jgi:hypothetical protein
MKIEKARISQESTVFLGLSTNVAHLILVNTLKSWITAQNRDF